MNITCRLQEYFSVTYICIVLIFVSVSCNEKQEKSRDISQDIAISDQYIMTVNGPISPDNLGITLPHEHIIVDFIGADSVSKDRYNPDSVVLRAIPFLEQFKELGGQALFECTPAYLGRDVEILKRLSDSMGIHIITNTGYYGTRKGIFLPQHVQTEEADQLAARWVSEWEDGIEGTTIKPGFIKISVNPDTFTVIDQKIVEAAALTHLKTGLTIGSHTTSGTSVLKILDILEDKGVSPNAFIWIHAQTVNDSTYHQQVAEAGAWIEFDGVRPSTGSQNSVVEHADWVMMMQRWGYLDQVLVSHDAGWYHVGEPGGGNFRSYETVFTEFIPELNNRGMEDALIDQIFITNPRNAFSIQIRKNERLQ